MWEWGVYTAQTLSKNMQQRVISTLLIKDGCDLKNLRTNGTLLRLISSQFPDNIFDPRSTVFNPNNPAEPPTCLAIKSSVSG